MVADVFNVKFGLELLKIPIIVCCNPLSDNICRYLGVPKEQSDLSADK